MRIKLLLSLLLMLMITTSCKTHYDIVMTHVEVPEDYRKQFGETKVLSLSENEITKYTYEDEMISFIWYVSKSQFNFLLKKVEPLLTKPTLLTRRKVKLFLKIS